MAQEQGRAVLGGPQQGALEVHFLWAKLLSDKFANVLHKAGARKGDRIFVYLPRIPELYISAVAIAKIGGIFAPLFGGFRAEAVRDRMNDCGAEMVVTTPDMKQLGIDPIGTRSRRRTIIICQARKLQVRRGELNLGDDVRRKSSDGVVPPRTGHHTTL
jgi:acetyl-CoA synthetase